MGIIGIVYDGLSFFMGVRMSIILSVTTDDDNVVNKTLTSSLTVAVNIPYNIDNQRPVIVLASSGVVDYSDYNYMTIPSLKRSYFVEFEQATPQLVKLHCRVDLLGSYQDDILASKALIQRAVKVGDYYDGNIDSNVNQTSTRFASDKGLIAGDHTNILTTVGVRQRYTGA